jgi:hypothetical protein
LYIIFLFHSSGLEDNLCGLNEVLGVLAELPEGPDAVVLAVAVGAQHVLVVQLRVRLPLLVRVLELLRLQLLKPIALPLRLTHHLLAKGKNEY